MIVLNLSYSEVYYVPDLENWHSKFYVALSQVYLDMSGSVYDTIYQKLPPTRKQNSTG